MGKSRSSQAQYGTQLFTYTIGTHIDHYLDAKKQIKIEPSAELSEKWSNKGHEHDKEENNKGHEHDKEETESTAMSDLLQMFEVTKETLMELEMLIRRERVSKKKASAHKNRRMHHQAQ